MVLQIIISSANIVLLEIKLFIVNKGTCWMFYLLTLANISWLITDYVRM